MQTHEHDLHAATAPSPRSRKDDRPPLLPPGPGPLHRHTSNLQPEATLANLVQPLPTETQRGSLAKEPQPRLHGCATN